MPWAMPGRLRGNPFIANGQPGFLFVATRMAMSMLQVVATLPSPGADPRRTRGARRGELAVPVGTLSGGGAAWWFGRRAQRRLAERGSELLDTLRVVA